LARWPSTRGAVHRRPAGLTAAAAGFGQADAVAKARAALAITPACPDAHTLLALYDAASLDEALEHYRAAQRCASGALEAGDELAATLEAEGVHAWTYATVRPYLRAVHGVANTLRKLERWQESLQQYEYAPCDGPPQHGHALLACARLVCGAYSGTGLGWVARVEPWNPPVLSLSHSLAPPPTHPPLTSLDPTRSPGC
jgi:tetratricopeptide (TPR) repeat protein